MTGSWMHERSGVFYWPHTMHMISAPPALAPDKKMGKYERKGYNWKLIRSNCDPKIDDATCSSSGRGGGRCLDLRTLEVTSVQTTIFHSQKVRSASWYVMYTTYLSVKSHLFHRKRKVVAFYFLLLVSCSNPH